MPVPNRMGVRFTETELEEARTAFHTLINLFNRKMMINLTKDERSAGQSVAERRLPFVQLAYDNYIPQFPQLRPPFGNLDDANADYDYMMQVYNLMTLEKQVGEIMGDHFIAAGIRNFEYMRDHYAIARRGRLRNVPGADTVVDGLSPLFDQENDPQDLPENDEEEGSPGGNPTA